MRVLAILVLAVFLCPVTPAYGKARHYKAVVADPFLELHTGPGRGYPVFHVVDRGDEIEIIKRRTSWYQVRTVRGVRGWVAEEQIARTLDTGGSPVPFRAPTADDYLTRRFETGVQVGDLDGASVISVYGAFHFTRNLSAELRASDLSGDFSDGWLATVGLVHQPFPEWRLTPYAMLGTGVIRIEPRATLVSTEDRTDQVGFVGLGLRTFLSRRVMLRAEYNGYVVFTSRDDNEEVNEWKAGLAFFF